MPSTKYQYIQVAVTVADSNGIPSDLSYNNAPMVTLPALTQISGMFLELSDGYLMWETPGKRAFTYFRMASESAPELSVTLMLDADVLTPGRPVIALLNDLRERLTGGDTIDNALMERLIEEAGFAEEPLRAHIDIDTLWQQGSEICYRTYSSTAELNNIFGFPRQESYRPYRGVLVVSSAVITVPEASLAQITTAVDKALMVVCPPEVTASDYRVSFSDHLTITYSCEGFDPVSVMFEVGTTNRYVRINGPALVVNNAHHAGIIFHRRIPYTVEAVGGTPIDTYTILINGRTANRSDDGFEISNTDFINGPVKITVSSTNFSSFSQEFTPETLEAAAPLNVVLQPDSREILLRLDFGNGRVVEEKLNIEKNTPEYCQLRAGDFHGFRAHRLMGSNTETYNIDVKPTPAVLAPRESTVQAPAVALVTPAETGTPTPQQPAARPAAPAESPQLPLTDAHTPVAPKIEKAPSAIWSPKKSDVVTPNFTNETIQNAETDEEKAPAEPLAAKLRSYLTEKTILVALTVVLGVIAIWFLASLFTSGSEEAEGAAPADSTALTTPGGTQPPVSTPTLSADEQADVAYLNSNSKWRRSELKSDKYRALLTAMAEGDIDAVARHPYFATKGQCSGKQPNAMVDYLWKAKGSFSEKANVRKLKAAAAKEVIDLPALNDDLARSKPAEPNTAPRP